MSGKHCLRTWSTTQGTIALSTAEAELYAMVDGVPRMKGMKSMLVEFGLASCDDVIELQRSGEVVHVKTLLGKDATCGAERLVDPVGGW